MKNSIDLTYSGELKIFTSGLNTKTIDVLYTIEGNTGKPTTTSLILDYECMVTFDYQQLKSVVERK